MCLVGCSNGKDELRSVGKVLFQREAYDRIEIKYLRGRDCKEDKAGNYHNVNDI